MGNYLTIFNILFNMKGNKMKAVSQRTFWDAKVNHYIQMFEYGRDTSEQFITNMVRMGFKVKDIDKALGEYYGR